VDIMWNQTTLKKRVKEISAGLAESLDDSSLLLERSALLCKLCDWKAAATDAAHAGKVDPDNWLAWSRQGYICMEQQQWEAAVTFCSKALSLQKDAGTYTVRAKSLANLDRRQDALNDLMQAVRLDPSGRDGLFAQGLYHQWDRNFRAAMKSYEKCIESDGNEYVAYWYLAECLVEVGDVENAIAAFENYSEHEVLQPNYAAQARAKANELKRKL